MFTGYLKYKDINHSFVFDEKNNELQFKSFGLTDDNIRKALKDVFGDR